MMPLQFRTIDSAKILWYRDGAIVEGSKVPEAGSKLKVKKLLPTSMLRKKLLKSNFIIFTLLWSIRSLWQQRQMMFCQFFSAPRSLKLRSEQLQLDNDDIPTVFWVVSISISVVTLLAVLGVTVVVVKVRSLKHGNRDLENANSIYEKPLFTSKRISWIESPRDFREKKNVNFTTFQSDFLMSEHTSSDYDYATSDHNFLSSDVSSHSNTYIALRHYIYLLINRLVAKSGWQALSL
jgi:hypothetical protein